MKNGMGVDPDDILVEEWKYREDQREQHCV